MNKPGRRYVFTSYDLDAVFAYTPDSRIKFICYQTEKCPTTDVLHVQGYIVLPSPQKPGFLKKLLNDPALHVEHAKGNDEQCFAYCTKEDSRAPEEDYVCVIYGDRSGQGQRTDVASFVEAIKTGATDRTLVDEHPVAFLRYQRGVAAVRAATATPRCPNTAPDVRVYWGETGTGTRFANCSRLSEDRQIRARA